MGTPRILRTALCFIALSLVTLPLFAQGTGTLVGQVEGPDGQVLPGAEIRVLDTTNTTATAVDGRFRLVAIPSGS